MILGMYGSEMNGWRAMHFWERAIGHSDLNRWSPFSMNAETTDAFRLQTV